MTAAHKLQVQRNYVHDIQGSDCGVDASEAQMQPIPIDYTNNLLTCRINLLESPSIKFKMYISFTSPDTWKEKIARGSI